MCHIDLSNCFWSLQLPREFWGAFRVSDGEGGVLAFRCLPFGWKYSPLLCQRVLEGLMADAGLSGVLVLIYLLTYLLNLPTRRRHTDEMYCKRRECFASCLRVCFWF